MSNITIKAESLGKLYRIGQFVGYHTLRESIMDAALFPFRALRSTARKSPGRESIWALKDVSFEIERGEVVGIIGRNGAGKSTLLKVLARITEPTEGYVEARGRVGSLLEVGTGFHPELTGKENVYLNGAILGMKKKEIDRKFDEIIDFSGVEKFIDTPLKRYSSGMQVRLAFAIAAHLEPEILLVDEVLAVGDAEFQQKSLGKMNEIARAGRTVLFVSHNLDSILRLVNRVIVLEEGVINFDGLPQEGVSQYINLTGLGFSASELVPADSDVDIHATEVSPIKGTKITSSSSLRIAFEYTSKQRIKEPHIIIGLRSTGGQGIHGIIAQDSDLDCQELPSQGRIVCETSAINLTAGYCYLNIAIFSGNIRMLHRERVAEFFVEPDQLTASHSARREWFMGILPSRWEVQEL